MMRICTARRGFSLLEMSIALGLAGITMGGLWQVMGAAGKMQETRSLASQTLAVAIAAQAYINENQSTIIAATGLTTVGDVACIKVRTADSCSTSLSSLEAGGYLPSGFSYKNSYGQSYALYVRHEAGDKLLGLVITTGGIEISDKVGALAASQIGAAGGFIYDADDADASGVSTGGVNASTVRGASGGWSITLTSGNWTTVGSAAQQGHMAALTQLVRSTAGGGSSGGTTTVVVSGGATSIDELTDGRTYHTNEYLFMGQNAGASTNTALSADATIVGADAGKLATDNTYSVIYGAKAISGAASGNLNTAFGSQAAYTLAATHEGVSPFGSSSCYGAGASDFCTALGTEALYSVTSTYTTAAGYRAGYTATTGTATTAFGYKTAYRSTAYANAVGAFAMSSNDGATGFASDSGTALGYYAGGGITATADAFVYIGAEAGRYNTTSKEVGIGYKAAAYNGSGTAYPNVSIGHMALGSNASTSIEASVAIGAFALGAAQTSQWSTAVGYEAFKTLTGGDSGTAVGYQAGYGATENQRDTYFGYQAGRNIANVGGSSNIAVGYQALATATTGYGGIALGYKALYANGDASYNLAIGYNALALTTVFPSTAVGAYALDSLTTGTSNTAVGTNALTSMDTSSSGTAVGYNALALNTAAGSTAVGATALDSNTSGIGNTAVGTNALTTVSTNGNNTAGGYNALTLATGSNNTAFGSQAGASVSSGSDNTLLGYNAGGDNGTINSNVTAAIQTGSNNTLIGSQASVTSSSASNRTAIGYQAVATADNQVVLGNSSVTSIGSWVAAWSNTSDRRLKRDIEDSDLGLDFIMQLQPVRYRLIKGNDRLDYGFIAQDVDKALGGRMTNMVYRDGGTLQLYRLSLGEMVGPSIKALQEQQGQRQSLLQAVAKAEADTAQIASEMAAAEKRLQRLMTDLKHAQAESVALKGRLHMHETMQGDGQ